MNDKRENPDVIMDIGNDRIEAEKTSKNESMRIGVSSEIGKNPIGDTPASVLHIAYDRIGVVHDNIETNTLIQILQEKIAKTTSLTEARDLFLIVANQDGETLKQRIQLVELAKKAQAKIKELQKKEKEFSLTPQQIACGKKTKNEIKLLIEEIDDTEEAKSVLKALYNFSHDEKNDRILTDEERERINDAIVELRTKVYQSADMDSTPDSSLSTQPPGKVTDQKRKAN